MKPFGIGVRSKFRRTVLLLAVVVFVALGATLWVNAWNTNSGLTMPSTGIVTVTGYEASSPENPSARPQSVVLSDSQAATLRRSISEIPILNQPTGRFICMINETVFRIAVKGAQSSSRTVWVARAERCPAPGILYVHGQFAGKPEGGRYCTLKTLLLSIFPKGTANVTRKELRSC